jgi:hypothetical protein
MSFDKEYPNRKDHRKPFQTKAEKVSSRCRHGGTCNKCIADRTINKTKLELKAQNDIQHLAEDLAPETETV